jgi:predicted AlkP superfamily pyrophosphatase or phosphodiesterase
MSFVKCVQLAVLGVAIPIAQPSHAAAQSVLMISIDGLRADDLTKAEEHGYNLPTLRALAASGASATSVRGVLPTITYPSHTTMITGVHPAKHGIVDNVAFDPTGKNIGGWMWYAQDIKVPTLWDMVKAKGGKVASIGWPATVGTRVIDYHIPEYWRSRQPEDEKLIRALSTPDMPDEIAGATGVSFAKVVVDAGGVHEGIDEARMAWAPAIIARYRPRLFTLHLIGLDGARHVFGPWSPEAKATLEALDRGLGTMIAKARAADPSLVVAVVSDHGFLPISKGLNLVAALAAEGLVTFGADGKVADWSAFPRIVGGSAAIVLKDPADKAVEQRVRQILTRLLMDPANGVDKILERPDIARLGGSPDAAFWVAMKSGYETVGGADKALVRDVRGGGTHGYSPEEDAMLSVFMIAGPGIAPGQLGAIDMRDIGPTVGAVLGAQLPHYDGKVLPVLAPRK